MTLFSDSILILEPELPCRPLRWEKQTTDLVQEGVLTTEGCGSVLQTLATHAGQHLIPRPNSGTAPQTSLGTGQGLTVSPVRMLEDSLTDH